ncbi:uncharacterized protein G2W53_014107 [Senna tora]|uniref:Uncharacterized protein n=1 Tax=Senna tora TaxID=362788 RepID=A0A834U0R6_9FABA|nr:uncharacterized protein G2W53_014107 [Senna tora]
MLCRNIAFQKVPPGRRHLGDQSGKTMSKLESSEQYLNKGGGGGPEASQSNMSSKSGNLPGYHLINCNITHTLNIPLLCLHSYLSAAIKMFELHSRAIGNYLNFEHEIFETIADHEFD